MSKTRTMRHSLLAIALFALVAFLFAMAFTQPALSASATTYGPIEVVSDTVIYGDYNSYELVAAAQGEDEDVAIWDGGYAGSITSSLYVYDVSAVDFKGEFICSYDGTDYVGTEMSLEAGDYLVTLDWIADGAFAADTADFVMVVQPRPTRATLVAPSSMVYDATSKAAVATYEDKDGVAQSLMVSVIGDEVNVGNFSVSFVSPDNYEIQTYASCGYAWDAGQNAFVSDAYTITPRPVTITNNNAVAPTFVYGDAITANPYDFLAVKEGSLPLVDDLGTAVLVGLTVNNVPVAIGDVGDVAKYYLTATANNSNYTITTDFDQNAYLEITKAPLTITATDKGTIYGNAAPSFEYTYEGFRYDDDMGDLGGSITLSCDYAVGDNRGNYAITPSGLTSSNYEISFVAGTLSVGKRSLTITNTNQEPLTKVYGDHTVYDLNPYSVVSFGGDGLAPCDLAVIATNPQYVQSIVPITVAVGADKASATPILSPDGSNFGYAATYWLYIVSAGVSDNYAVTDSFDANAKLVVTPAPLTVTADAKSVTYGNEAPEFTVSYEGFIGGAYNDGPSKFVGTMTFDCEYVPGSVVGTYDITPGGVSNGNYSITFTKGTLTVQKRSLTVSYKNEAPISYVYGNHAVYDLNPYEYVNLAGLASCDLAAISTNPQYVQSIVPITIAVGSNKATASPILSPDGSNFGYAATYWLYIVSAGVSANYTVTDSLNENAKLVITPAPLTITAENKEIAYGDAAPTFTVSYDGFIGAPYNDSEAKLTGTLSFACDYTVGDNVDTYDILPSGVSNGNYTITFAKGTLTVTKKTITVSYKDDEPITYVYGNHAVYSLNPYEHVNLVGIASCDLAVIATNPQYVQSLVPITVAVGSNKATASPILSPNGSNFGYAATYWLYIVSAGVSANYTVTDALNENAKLVVTPAPLTITAEDKEVTYGGEAPEFTVTYDGFIPAPYNDSEAKLTGTLSFTCSYQPGSAVGTYDIVPSGVSNGNYTITFVHGTLTVTKRAVTVSYKNDEPISFVYGNYAVYSLNPYEHVNFGGEGLAPCDLAVIATNPQYVQSLVPITVAVGSDKASATPLLTLNGSNFGYAATYWLYIVSAGVSGNYEITDSLNANAKLVISPAPLTVTAEAKSVTYGDEAPEFTVSYDGFIGAPYSDGPEKFKGELAFACEYAAGEGVGEYAITPSGVSNGNYAIRFVNGTLTVRKKEITIANTNDAPFSYVYGDIDVFTKSIAHTIFIDTISGEYVGEDNIFSVVGFEYIYKGQSFNMITAPKCEVGRYDMRVFSVSDNYEVTAELDENAYLEVTKSPLTITADAKSVTYGDAAPAFTVTASSFRYGDALADLGGTLSFATIYTVTSPVGTYDVVPSGLTSDNYEITFVKGVLTVGKRSAVITADDKSSYCKEPLAALTYTARGVVNGDVVCRIESNANKDVVGVYTITLTPANDANYELTLNNGVYTVKEAQVTVETNEKGEKEVSTRKDLSVDEAKSEGGVEIKGAIEGLLDAAADAPVVRFEIKVGDSSVVFDKAALTALRGNDEVKFSFVTREDEASELVIEVSLGGATFDGGKVTVTTAFEDKAPVGKVAKVFFVDAKGKKTDMKATFEDGKLSFVTGHFSTYVVEYVLSGGAIAGIVIACVVLAAGIAVCLCLLIRKKRNEKASD